MASQQITEILTRIVVDTTQAEEALRRFAAARDRALNDGGAATRQTIAQEIDARIAAIRRGIEAETQLRNQSAVTSASTRLAIESQTQEKIVAQNTQTASRIVGVFDGGARQSAASRINIENQVQGQIVSTAVATSAKIAANDIQNARNVGAARIQIARDVAAAEASARGSFRPGADPFGGLSQPLPRRQRGISDAALSRAASAGLDPLYFDGISRDIRGLNDVISQLGSLRSAASNQAGPDPKITRAIARLEGELDKRRADLSTRLDQLGVGFTIGKSGRMSELESGQAFVGTQPGNFRSVPVTGDIRADREALKNAVRAAFGTSPLAGGWASMDSASGLPQIAIDPSVRTSLNKAVALGLTTAQEAAYARLPGTSSAESISIPDLLRAQTSGPRGESNKREIVRLIGGRLDDVDGSIAEAVANYQRGRAAVSGLSGDAARRALRDAGLGAITPIAQQLGLVRQGPGATGAGNAPDAGLDVDKTIAELRAQIRERNKAIVEGYRKYLRVVGAMSFGAFNRMENVGMLRLPPSGSGYASGSMYDALAPLPLLNETISPQVAEAMIADPILRQIAVEGSWGKTPRLPSDRILRPFEGGTGAMQSELGLLAAYFHRDRSDRMGHPIGAISMSDRLGFALNVAVGSQYGFDLRNNTPTNVLNGRTPNDVIKAITEELLPIESSASALDAVRLSGNPPTTARDLRELIASGLGSARSQVISEPIQVFGQSYSSRAPLLPGQIVTPSVSLFDLMQNGFNGSPFKASLGPERIFTVDPGSLSSVGAFSLNSALSTMGLGNEAWTQDYYSYAAGLSSLPENRMEQAFSQQREREKDQFTGLYRYNPLRATGQTLPDQNVPSYLGESVQAISNVQAQSEQEGLVSYLRSLLQMRRRGMASTEFLTGGLFGSAADRTAQAGFEQLSFGFGGPSGGAGGGEDPNDAKRNEEKISENVRAERAKRAADLRRANAQTRLESARLRDDLSDIFRVGPALADRITGIDDLRFGLQSATQQATIARTELSRLEAAGAPRADVIRAQQRLNEALAEQARIAGRLGGPGGLARGVAGAFVSTAIQAAIVTPIYAAAQAAVQFGFEETSKYIDRLINPTKAATAAFDALGQSVASLGGAEKFGKLLGLTPQLQAIADLAEKTNRNKAAFDALTQLFLTSALASGTGQAPEEFLFDQRLKQNRETILEQLGFGNPLASLLTGITPGSSDLARRQAAGFGPEGLAAFNRVLAERRGTPQSQALSFLGDALPFQFGPFNALASAEDLKAALAAAADESFRGKSAEAEAAQAIERRKEIAGGLVAALRAGTTLTAEQQRVLKEISTEEQRRVLLSFAIRDAVRQETAAKEELASITEDIAILEGRASGDANKDALEDIRKTRERLDGRERAIEERAFRRQRQQAIDDIEANLRRAGIRQAGQTGFDVAAAQREAEAQADRARQGFRDEDERRAITKIRRELDERERAIRRVVELEALRLRKASAEDSAYFAELQTRIVTVGRVAATAITELFNAGIAGASALIAALGYGTTGADLGRDGYGGRYAAGGRVGRAGMPIIVGEFGPELFVPDSVGTIASNARLQRSGETTIVLEPMNIVLDGEVIGRTIERRVTARSNRRAALGIA